MTDDDARLHAMATMLQEDRLIVLQSAKGHNTQERNLLSLWVQACIAEAATSWLATNPKETREGAARYVAEALAGMFEGVRQ